MTRTPTEAVIAGSKGFALALLAPLTERVGLRPRIASDAAQALKLTAGAGLVVVEFQGDGSLDGIRQLVAQGSGVAVIAAVSEVHAAAEASLRSMGVEPARWDGKPDGVLSVVTRRLAAVAGRAGGSPAPALGSVFDDLLLDAPARGGQARAPAALPGAAAAPPPAPERDWPGNVPSAAETAAALDDAVRGVFPPQGAPLAIVAEVMAGMSALERAVLLGEAQPIDAEPVRRAAITRVRVAVALATAPQAGAAVDDGAVSALLAQIDALLSDVNALVAAAPPALQASLEQVRNALVKEAIDFSEASHPATAAEAVPAARPGVTTAAERRASHTRLLSIASSGQRDVEAAIRRRQRTLATFLAAALALAGGYHGYLWYRARAAAGATPERVTRAGAPADAFVSGPVLPDVPIVLRTDGGRPFTPQELRRIEDEEALRGNTVRVASPSSVVIVRSRAGAPR